MSEESGEKRHHSGGDELEDGPGAGVEGERDPHNEGDERVDDAVLNDFKQSLDTEQGDSLEKQVSDFSESVGDSAEDPGDQGSTRGESGASAERDVGDRGLEECLADYQGTLSDSKAAGDAENEKAEPEEKGSEVTDQGKDNEIGAQDSVSVGGAKGEGDDGDNVRKQGDDSQITDTQNEVSNFAGNSETSLTESQYERNCNDGHILCQEDSLERSDTVDLNTVHVYDARVVGAGELLSDWRNNVELTQYELADSLHCDQSLISCWESNKSFIPLEELQQTAQIIGTDLDRSLRELQVSNPDLNMEWKGKHYTLDSFLESIQDSHATLNYNEAQQTYFLELNPIADAEFHRTDKITALLEQDGTQSIAQLTACKGVRANIKAGTVERMGIELGDELRLDLLNIRGRDEGCWEPSIQVSAHRSDEGISVRLNGEIEQLGFNVVEGDYARMVVQTDRGEGLVMGVIQDGAVRLGEAIATELLGSGRGGDHSLTAKTDSIVISQTPFKGEAELNIGLAGEVHVSGLLSDQGFSHMHGGEILRADITLHGEDSDARNERRLGMSVSGTSHEIHSRYLAQEGSTMLQMKLENMVVLNSQDTIAVHGSTLEGFYSAREKSMMGTEVFDSLTRHIGAETVYQVDRPNQSGIDRIIEKDGKIILVEEKAEHKDGIAWRTTTTISQVMGYGNRFQELVEENHALTQKLHSREPDGIEIWTTARVPKDENGEIDIRQIHLYDGNLGRNLVQGEPAILNLPYQESGEIHSHKVSGIDYSVFVSEDNEVIFSIPTKHAILDSGREIIIPCDSSSASDSLQIKVKHYDHVNETCRDAEMFDAETRANLREICERVGQRLNRND